MKPIAKQVYIEVERGISGNQQYYIDQEHELILYQDRLESSNDTFYLQDVFDLSYRSLSQQIGFFYIHSNRGVYSFQVKKNPARFIESFKDVKR
ncbi:hypothetical protein LS684_09385 [Cytobacillus spongiae]|uniref:hypothetical protein n=1 Tax=Cytobacillus spongiae TaxID=2901381 RepID=UPI001F28D674|nr:hypothetical protein [Cytobacillus spongiae]UII57615.1 hypothetical protein LS684_09385 [Cytobacillus spongiae]